MDKIRVRFDPTDNTLQVFFGDPGKMAYLSPIDDDLDGLTPLDDDGLAPMDDDGGLEPVAESPAPAAASLFDKLPAASVPEASAAAGLDDILGGATADPLADPLLSSAATAESASPSSRGRCVR